MNNRRLPSIIATVLILSVSCALIPRNLEEYDDNVKSITFINPIGVDVRAPNGADMYLFRAVSIKKSMMIGVGIEFAQVMYMQDSELFVSLLNPYFYYSPVAIVERDKYGPDGPRGIRTRIMTFIYAGGSLLSIPRKKLPESPSRSLYDFGAGLTFKRFELRIGAVNKYRKSTQLQSLFYYAGLSYNLFGGKWKLEW